MSVHLPWESVSGPIYTARPLEVFYQMRITTHYDFISWDQIESVVRKKEDSPTMVSLYFAHGDRVKRLFFLKPDAENILALAKEQNPKVKLAEDDGTPIVIPKNPKKA